MWHARQSGVGARPFRRGFTLVEFMVLLGIVVILIAIFVPYAADVRESSNRQRCQENLRKIGIALSNYASDNHGILPRVVYDEKNNPNGYTSFTGPDSGNPFGNDGKVSANDVTASLWLLVRQRYIPADYTPASSVFVCPSSWAKVDPLVDAAGNPVSLERRGNFRKAWNLSYSYCSPFSNAAGYGMISDFLSSTFVVMADKNPGIGKDSDVTGPAWDAPRELLAKANSRNHGRAGQSVLYGDMHVEFVRTPYCGMGGDNIYTALAKSPIFTGVKPNLKANGYCDPTIGPAWKTDSYLVPTDNDGPQ